MQWSHCSRAWSEHGEWQSEEKITKCCHRLFYNAVSHYSRSVKGLVSFVKFGVPRIFLGLGMLAGYDSRYLVPQILYLHPSNHTFLWVGCEFFTWKMVLQYSNFYSLSLCEMVFTIEGGGNGGTSNPNSSLSFTKLIRLTREVVSVPLHALRRLRRYAFVAPPLSERTIL